MNKLVIFALTSSLVIGSALSTYAGSSPTGKPIEPKQTEKEKKENKKKNEDLTSPSSGSGIVIPDITEGLRSPDTGGLDGDVLGAYRDGFVDDEGTKIPKDAFDEKKGKVNWDIVEAYNPEIYAWIRIPKTNVDYPILQRESILDVIEDYSEQLYYVWHDFYDEEKMAGAIFSQYPSDLEFNDQINILYGNNVIDGSMFQNLHKFMQDVDVKDLHLSEENEKELLSKKINEDNIREFNEDDLITEIYTKSGRKLIFRIYSAYYWTDEHLQFYVKDGKIGFKLQTPEEIAEYIANTKNPKSLRYLVYDVDDVDENSKILTMSTSIKGNENSRLLVQAVFLNEENIQEGLE